MEPACGDALEASERGHLLARYQVPEPRCSLAEAVRRHAAGAMDVSDGLAGDLAKLCQASGCSAEVEVERVPLSDGARKLAVDPRLMETALTGGDDYEILCAVRPSEVAVLQSAAAAASIALTEIGRMVAGGDVPRFRDPEGRVLIFARPSFSHF